MRSKKDLVNLDKGQVQRVAEIIDKQTNIAVLRKRTEKEKEGIAKAFKSWLKLPFPKFLDNNLIKEHEMIIRVFSFRPPKNEGSKILLDNTGRTADDLKYRTFSIAQIMKVGESCVYEEGAYVRLRDFDVASIKNPDYAMWIDNEHSKSNLRQVGDAPPEFMNNIGRTLGPKMILLNPLKTELDEEDFLTFKVTPNDISHPIKNVEDFVV